jgi:hypothetical protein
MSIRSISLIKCRFKQTILLLCCLLPLTACTFRSEVHTDSQRTVAPYNEVPVSSNFQTNNQLKLQAAQHWANIADDTGKAIATLLRKGLTCTPRMGSCEAVFINPPAYVTEFSRTFHNQLLTTLVSSGLNVSKTPESAALIDIDVQPVTFASNRPQYRYAGVATELGQGIWALRDVSTMKPSDPSNSTVERDALHWFRTQFAAGQTPNMEIVVTVSASTKKRYLARSTNIYYVTEGDRSLYDQEICSLIKPCAKATGAPPTPARKVGITGDCPLDKTCCPADKNCAVNDLKPQAKTTRGM